MSTWIDIKNQEDVDISPECKGNYMDVVIAEATIDVCYSTDHNGANYISIPIRFILEVLKKEGYEIKQ